MGLLVHVLICAGRQLFGVLLGCLPGFLLGLSVFLVLIFKTDAINLEF